jgi:hypothetical protein
MKRLAGLFVRNVRDEAKKAGGSARKYDSTTGWHSINLKKRRAKGRLRFVLRLTYIHA